MKEQSLNGLWTLTTLSDGTEVPAQVPGTVYEALLENGKLEDPFYRDNEIAACEKMEEDYLYSLTFGAAPEILACPQVLLRFDGLDTVADIRLNGEALGSACNMHRTWEYPVKDLLQPTGNKLEILLHSPNRWIRDAFKACRTLGNDDTFEGFVHLRKAHYMFGWDWGAHLPDAGIFRPVSLLGLEGGRIHSVYIRQRHEVSGTEAGTCRPVVSKVTLTLEPDFEGPQDYAVRITAPDGTVFEDHNSPKTMEIPDPMLWWPNGYGEQNLYTVEVTQLDGDRPVDTWVRRIGLRRVTVHREKDQWGESFAHEVNGLPIFAMGADYIPEDNLLGRVTPETTKTLLEKAKFANFNSIRVWGGGYYPSDWFYDLCDEMGFLVWQDFMFACAVYELTPEFEANIRAEFADNIVRLRHHASLALWCGNNEMELFVANKNEWLTKPTEVRDYLLMFERILPEMLKEYDPETYYWPASPSSGGSFDDPGDPDRGDSHYWSVWHGNRPFSEYRKYFFRYASEFGFQAFPALKTLETITDDPDDLNPFSYIMEKHQRQYGANGKIMGYMQQTYKYPTSFPIFIYASQLLQADAIRYGVEHFRRNRGRCMGAIYWQLNDCWPVVSWSSIDYLGRMKALHYYARRFFRPLMLSCQEEGMMNVEANMNREHFEFPKAITLCVANETVEPQTVTVRWALRTPTAEVLESSEEQVTVAALSSLWLQRKEFPNADIFRHYVSYEMEQDGEIISSGTVNFSYPKYFRYADPKLSVRQEGEELVISAAAYAKSVEIQNENEDLVLSDNYFDMNGGEKRVCILSGSLDGLRLRSVFDIH